MSGQDGAYLAKLLLEKGYRVCGTSRDARMSTFANLERLGIRDQVQLESVALNDFRSVIQALFKVQPDEVYHLAGQSSVSLSFEQPVETQESIYVATLNLLEAIRFTGRAIRFYNASSSECFGDLEGAAADEETPFRPRSPYAVAKSAAFWQVANYREAYGLFACSGILFNHESPLRPNHFVTKKIAAAACRIAAGDKEKLILGNIEVQRDWGWASRICGSNAPDAPAGGSRGFCHCHRGKSQASRLRDSRVRAPRAGIEGPSGRRSEFISPDGNHDRPGQCIESDQQIGMVSPL